MKVKDLIKHLEVMDQELPVCVFHDMGAMLVHEPYVLTGNYEDPDNRKLVFKNIKGKFVALGNYADYDLEDERYIHEE